MWWELQWQPWVPYSPIQLKLRLMKIIKEISITLIRLGEYKDREWHKKKYLPKNLHKRTNNKSIGKNWTK